MAVTTPFALLTDQLFFLPSPSSGHVQPYRDLFRKLHADASFCQIAFGDHFLPVNWTDDEVKDVLLKRDAALRWGRRGMGDFALGLLPEEAGKVDFSTLEGRLLKNSETKVRIIEGTEFERVLDPENGFLAAVQWVGYTCVRDATTSSLEDLASRKPDLPPWQEMIEMRYGMDPAFWGRGIAPRAAAVAMQWAVEEHGVRRFIAGTMLDNVNSGRVLEKLGFKNCDTGYFEEGGVFEWERVV